jgi:cytochrome c2
MNDYFQQGRQFLEQTVTYIPGNEMAFQGGQLTIHSDVHFAV